MIPGGMRAAIIDLAARGWSKSAIAAALGTNRTTVRRVIASAAAKPATHTESRCVAAT